MPILVSQLTEGRKLECITVDKSVKEAMQCMLAHDYSQLPVVSVDGKLVGLISDQSIAQRHYYLNGVSLLDYAVTDCCSPAPTIDPNEDIFAILTQLETSYATVVVANESPVGIVTNYDTTQFFVKVAGGLVRAKR